MMELTKRSQTERLIIVDTLLTGIREELSKGKTEENILQLAVNCQVEINRIVFKLNHIEED